MGNNEKKNVIIGLLFEHWNVLRNYFPLKQSMTLHLNRVDFTTQRENVPSLFEIGPMVLEKKICKLCQCTNSFAIS